MYLCFYSATIQFFPPYLEVFRRAREDGSALLPYGALIVFQRPQDGLLVVVVPQEHPKVALGLAPELIGENEAKGPSVCCNHGADEVGSLLFRLQAGVHVEIAV